MNILKTRLLRRLFDPSLRLKVVFVVCCLGFSSLLGFFVPIKIKDMFGHYQQANLFYRDFIFLGIIFLATYINRVVYQLLINNYLKWLLNFIRNDCYSIWLNSFEVKNKKDKNGERYPLGEVLARIMNDTDSIRELITSGSFGIIIDFFFILFSMVSFISMNTTSGVFIMFIEIAACIGLVLGSKSMAKIFMKVRTANGVVARTCTDLISGLKENFYMKRYNYAEKRAEKSFDSFLTSQLEANVWDAGYYSLAESLYPILLALFVLIFPYSNIVETAIIAAIVDLIQRSIGPIKEVASKVSSIQRAATGFQRIDEFIQDLEESNLNINSNKMELGNLKKFSCSINKFSYQNEKKFSLSKINFNGNSGDLIGIIGKSGSGKSTLLNILCANLLDGDFEVALEFENGKVVFNGNDAASMLGYRSLVGIVSQDSHIFTDSLYFNISLGEKNKDEFDLFWAQAKIDIPYLILWEKNGDQFIDPKQLSLGQKQLISALRSCFLKKPIVLFDEISSAMDSKLEQSLRQAILILQKFALTIVVTHRLETVIEANSIIVMENGQVLAQGRHLDLLNNSKLYQSFIHELNQ